MSSEEAQWLVEGFRLLNREAQELAERANHKGFHFAESMLASEASGFVSLIEFLNAVQPPQTQKDI
jgi:hypothetical protein